MDTMSNLVMVYHDVEQLPRTAGYKAPFCNASLSPTVTCSNHLLNAVPQALPILKSIHSACNLSDSQQLHARTFPSTSTVKTIADTKTMRNSQALSDTFLDRFTMKALHSFATSATATRHGTKFHQIYVFNNTAVKT